MPLPRIVAGIVKTGIKKGETKSDKLVKRLLNRDVRKKKTQLNKDKRAILRKRQGGINKQLNSRNQRPLNKGSDDRSFGEIRAASEARSEAIKKALDKKKKGGMYNVGIGAAVILGAGTLTAQTAYADDLQVAKAPTNMDYISFYKPQPYTKKSGVRGPKKTHKTLDITQPFSLFK